MADTEVKAMSSDESPSDDSSPSDENEEEYDFFHGVQGYQFEPVRSTPATEASQNEGAEGTAGENQWLYTDIVLGVQFNKF